MERCVLDYSMTLLLLHTLYNFDRIINIHGVQVRIYDVIQDNH